MSQETKADGRPTRSHTKDGPSNPIDAKRYEQKEQPDATANGSLECHGDSVTGADDSLVEISPADVAARPKDIKARKIPTGGKASRPKRNNARSTATSCIDPPPQENTIDETPPDKPLKPRRKQTGAVSRHFKPPPEPPCPKKPVESPDEPLNIEPALSRRCDWTPPPKDTIKEFGSRSSDIIELLSSASKQQGAENSKDIFQKLKETYGYELEDESFPDMEPKNLESIFKKRKLVEMVSTSNGANAMAPPPPPQLEKSPTKQKAPKKKARTITGLATAAYEAKEPELPPPGPSDAPAPKPAAAAAPEKPKARATKRKAKAPKKRDDPRMVLYSPEAALKQVAQQDFVFGTSSQLVREQDWAEDLPKLRNDIPDIDEEYVTPINSDAIEPPEVQPKLWTAAARDEDGELLHLEVIDLVKDSPAAAAPSDDSDPFGYVNPERESQRPATKAVDKGADTGSSSMPKLADYVTPSLKATSRVNPHLQPKPTSSVVHDPLLGIMSSTSPPPSSQKRLSSLYEAGSASQLSPSPSKSGYTVPEKPKFDLYTDAQLARQVAAYGFKPIRKRAGMISLLDECWSSKYRRQAGVRAYSTAPSAAAAAGGGAAEAVEVGAQAVAEPAKRPRGRPRKDSAVATGSRASPERASPNPVPEKRPRGRPRKTTVPAASPRKSKSPPSKPAPSTPPRKPAAVLEIPDSESEPSSPDVDPVFSSPPAAHDVSLDASLALQPSTEEESSLHDYITRAVTSAPRGGPREPGWYERMLMYESVIVEDLAAWLNTGPLGVVGFDGEVSAGEVKGWCEARSVCCVWRERLRGGERKRL